MVAPGSWLHGASVRGSAAAPVSEPRAPVLIAPAKTTPRPSSTRRSSSPLPATGSSARDLALRPRRSEMLIFPPFLSRLSRSDSDAILLLGLDLFRFLAAERGLASRVPRARARDRLLELLKGAQAELDRVARFDVRGVPMRAVAHRRDRRLGCADQFR